jgi:hypothetical protein
LMCRFSLGNNHIYLIIRFDGPISSILVTFFDTVLTLKE